MWAPSIIAFPYHLLLLLLLLNYSIQPEAGLYNFSNIRYAEPPVGELRFCASVPPRKNRGKIIDQGKIDRVCPQASPAWSPVAVEFLRTYFAGTSFNASAFDSALANSLSSEPPSQDPRVSEDCLFLNVIVPQKVFEQAAPHRQPLAPVLVWIHGGGYTSGGKTDRGLYNPAGLIKTSQSSNSTGLVYVAINYRVSFHLKTWLSTMSADILSLAWCIWMAFGPRPTSWWYCQCRSLRSATCSTLGPKVHSVFWRWR